MSRIVTRYRVIKPEASVVSIDTRRDIRHFEHIIGPVYEMMRKCNLLEYKGSLFAAFPTVADAVHFARCNTELAWSSPTYEDTIVARL